MMVSGMHWSKEVHLDLRYLTQGGIVTTNIVMVTVCNYNNSIANGRPLWPALRILFALE